MKVLVQRVTSANVKVNNKVVGEINRGILLFVGFTQSDTTKEIDYMVDKVINLRIFDDENGVMNKAYLTLRVASYQLVSSLYMPIVPKAAGHHT